MTERKLRLPRLLFQGARPERPSSAYHAVEIRCSAGACEAAEAASDRRYLSKDAPLLPLAACDRPAHCKCRYRHYEDRRTEQRRGGDAMEPPELRSTAEERRNSQGRRTEDRADAADETASLLEDTYYDYVLNEGPRLKAARPKKRPGLEEPGPNDTTET